MRQFGWDFPPGVTGLEPEIAGAPEVMMRGVECDNDDAHTNITDDNGRVWPIIYDCPWSGDVEAVVGEGVHADYAGYWTCPLCGAENTDDLPDESDNDPRV